MSYRLFETYKNSVMPHGCHIYQTASPMAMETICAYPSPPHAFPHWKCVLHCYANFPHIDLPRKELDNHHSNICPTIRFNVYHLISHCIVHGICPLDENNFCRLCLCDNASIPTVKIYTIK